MGQMCLETRGVGREVTVGEHGSCIINTDSFQPPGCFDVSCQREAFSRVFWQNEIFVN